MEISATFGDGTVTDKSETTFTLSEVYTNVRASYINPDKSIIVWDQIQNVADYINVNFGASENSEQQIGGAQVEVEAVFQSDIEDITISFAGFYQQLITETTLVINRQTDNAIITIPKAPKLERFEAAAKDFETAEIEFDIVTNNLVDGLLGPTIYQDRLSTFKSLPEKLKIVSKGFVKTDLKVQQRFLNVIKGEFSIQIVLNGLLLMK